MENGEQNDSDHSIEDGSLPLNVIEHSDKIAPSKNVAASNAWHRRRLPKFFLLPFIPLLLFTGAVIGIYVQPPALRAFLNLTGLKPGGGTSSPIAVSVEDTIEKQPKQAMIRSVVAMGRLIPEGKVITISPPYGAADARMEEIKVAIGDQVERGAVLATLDNRASLESAVASAQANVALQKSSLEQTRMTITASLEEAQATLDRSKTAEALARRELDRQKSLRD